MKNKKRQAVLSLALAAVMLLGGCGQNTQESQEQTAVKNADGKYEPTLVFCKLRNLSAWKLAGG